MQNPLTLLVVLIAIVTSILVTGGILVALARSGSLSPMLAGIVFVIDLCILGVVFVRLVRR